MKRVLIIFAAIVAIAMAPTAAARAAESDGTASTVNITVVMPDVSAPAQSAPPVSPLYPNSVDEIRENGERRIIKVYELSEGENPENIPRGSFERGGWRYELADVAKSETALTDARNHVETVEVKTAAKDMDAILSLLAPTLDYESDDGYAGTLALDITTIKTESAGTKSSVYTVSATREYPRLSAADTSLIPKTITDDGRTLTLASVDWQIGNTVAVDYEPLAEYYTAVAAYTGTASKTSVTGYVTTAEYSGTVAKVSQGRTVYTAVFIGSEITPERARLDFAEPTPEAPEIPAASTPEPTSRLEEAPSANPWDLALPVALAALFAGVAAGYFLKIKSNRKDDANETH